MQYHASPCHTMPCQYTLPYNGEPVGHISCHTKPDLSFCHLGCTIPYHSTQCCTISYYAIPWKTTWAHATRCHAFPSGLHPRPACALYVVDCTRVLRLLQSFGLPESLPYPVTGEAIVILGKAPLPVTKSSYLQTMSKTAHHLHL